MDEKKDTDFWMYPMPVDPLWEANCDEEGRKVPGCFHTLPAKNYDEE